MEFSFTTYAPHRGTKKKQTQPMVEVKPTGRVTFNKLAAQLIEEKPYCMVAYDTANKAIGILPKEGKDINTFDIRYTAKGAYIGIKKFLKDTGLLPDSSVSHPPIKSGDYIAIKL